MKRPLEVIQRIGDKLIRDTPFEYRLDLATVPVRVALAKDGTWNVSR